MAKDLSNLSIAELEAMLTDLHTERKALAARKREVARVLDAKLIEQAAHEKLAAMSDTERAALRQALDAEGIASDEAFGTPGSA